MLKKFLNIFKNNKGSSESNGYRVLLVEDSPVDRRVIQKILETNGYTVFSTDNGEDGLQCAKKERLDLILLDCDLPGMNGPDICKRLKEDNRTEKVPVIFLTGSSAPTNIVNCFDLGAEHYLTKPVGAKELIQQVEETLGKR